MFATKILKYTVKSSSPTRTALTQGFGLSYIKPRYASSQNPPAIPVKDDLSAKSHENRETKSAKKRCAISDPINGMSKLEKTMLNDPNIEKAAALIQLIGDPIYVKKKLPHHIGSMPSTHVEYERKNAPTKISVVQNESTKDKRDEQEEEKTVKNFNDVKPYVINIYLDSKAAEKPIEMDENSLRSKIKEFWEESVREEEENIKMQQALELAETEEAPNRVMKIVKENDGGKGEARHVKAPSRQPPAKIKKTVEEDEEVKEAPKVTPVNTNGFAKFLTYWKQIFATRNDEVQKTKEDTKTIKPIPHEKVFNPSKRTARKLNRHDRYKEPEEPPVEVDTARKMVNRHQKSRYSTMCTDVVIRENFGEHALPETKCEGGRSGRGKNSSERPKDGNKTRVDEFVGKLKDAMAAEVKDFKKVTVIYDHNRKKIIDRGKARIDDKVKKKRP